MLGYRNTVKRISSDSEEDSDKEEKFATIVSLKRSQESELVDMVVEKPVQESVQQCNPVTKKRKVNNIWASVISENLLTDDLGQCELRTEGKYQKNRDVESYDYTRKALDTRPSIRREDLSPEPNSSEISITDLEPKGLDLPPEPPSKKKFKMSCKKNESEKVAKEIASKLQEPKESIIYRAVRVLGKQKMLEFFHMVEDIEQSGGIYIMSGTRRRTPGGVLFYLIKRASIEESIKHFIFEEDRQHYNNCYKQKKKAHKKMHDKFKRKMEFHRKKGEAEIGDSSNDLRPLLTRTEILIASEVLSESTSESSMEATEHQNSETVSTTDKANVDSELEEGEIVD